MTGTQDAVFISGADSYINNSGRISGRQTAVNASAGSATVIKNSGTLDGDVVLGSGVNKVVNTGMILGDVSLGNGGSPFNGHGGTVTGSITGGTGADTIRAGNDGEMLAGGKGHDTLLGGAGADTFAFSSFAAADSDAIRGFDVGLDTIQLDHAVFTRLRADATPSFSIGTNASGPTNYLFYNPTAGVLFYDTDGNGSRAPLAVATLAPNLNLTAGNFSVV